MKSDMNYMAMMNEVVNEVKVKIKREIISNISFLIEQKDILEGIYCTNNLY
jgi:hypothetical protein